MIDNFFRGLMPKNVTDHTISSDDLFKKTNFITNECFTKQLNRLVKANNGYVRLLDDRSGPDFGSLVSMLHRPLISAIEIECREDRNNQFPTLGVVIVLDDGVFNYVPQWTAYKEESARSINNTLLTPIHLYGFVDICYLIDKNKKPIKYLYESDLESEIVSVMSLAGFPNQIDPASIEGRKCVLRLKACNDVAERGLAFKDRGEAFFNHYESLRSELLGWK